jgi:hypothetical protein
MCLLDRPAQSQRKPKPSAVFAVARPQVDTVPGPVSEPGAFSVWTRFPGGVIGPPSASPAALILPGISTRQNARSPATSNEMGAASTPRNPPINEVKRVLE